MFKSAFDIVKEVRSKKRLHLESEVDQYYNAFVINRLLSQDVNNISALSIVNEMSSLPPNMQYTFLCAVIHTGNSFLRWNRVDGMKTINAVQEYYGVSFNVAKQYIELLTPESMAEILEAYEVSKHD